MSRERAAHYMNKKEEEKSDSNGNSSTDINDSKKTTTHAMILMLLSCFFFASMTLAIRKLSASDMHSTEIVFLRNVIAVVIMSLIASYYGWKQLKTKYIKRHISRAAIGIAGMQLWFYSLTVMPVNEATALSFTAPLFTAIIAVIFLKEAIGIHRILALIMGFVGVLVVLRPSADIVVPAYAPFLVLAATLFWGAAGVMVKSLTKLEPVWKIVFYQSTFFMIFSAPLSSVVEWTMPSQQQILYLLMVTTLGLVAHFCLVTAFSKADVVKLMPLDFTRLVFTAILAYLILGEKLSLLDALGAAIITASSVYIAWREKVRNKKELLQETKRTLEAEL